MFEDRTPESIKAEILADVDGLDTREGSFIQDMVAGIAYENWKIYDSLNAFFGMAFPDENSGEYIDVEGAKYGIIRKEGNKARVTLELSGESGATVEEGAIFATREGLEFVTTQEIIIESTGIGQGWAEAAQTGENYNVKEHTIIELVQSFDGIYAVSNPAAATGGSQTESDAALMERIDLFRKKPATSGNAYQYEQWAREVPGVGASLCIPAARGKGTVDVVIADAQKEPVNSAVIASCLAHIEEVRPIGADVLVRSAQRLTINVVVTVSLAQSTDLQSVKTRFEELLKEYLRAATFQTIDIKIAQLGALLMSIEGVLDYTGLLLNNSSVNVEIPLGKVPVLGSVTMR